MRCATLLISLQHHNNRKGAKNSLDTADLMPLTTFAAFEWLNCLCLLTACSAMRAQKKLLLCKTRKIQLLILNFIVPRDMFEMTTVEVRLPGGCTATGLATGAFILAARCVTVEVLVTSFGIHTSVACSLTSVTPMSHIPSYSYHCVEQIHSVGTISNTKTSYPTQLSIVTGATPGIKKWLGGHR